MPLRTWVRSVYRQLRASRYAYARQVEVRIRRADLLHNLRVFESLCAPQAIAPVLKSDAYGHGLVPTARVFDATQCPFMVVDGYHEALILRNEGVRMPLVVMGYTITENILRCRLRQVAFMVGDLTQLETLAGAARRECHIHLKINTGLARHGIAIEELSPALRVFANSRHLILEGACSHLADAVSQDEAFTRQQIQLWNEVAGQIENRVRYLHLSNTAGTRQSARMRANVARIGLGLYGIDTLAERKLDLRPALSVHSHIGSLRAVDKGTGIGYGLTWTAPKDAMLAMVPTGYNSCVDVRLSNQGAFEVDGVACPIVGRVCMNATMINVSKAPRPVPGSEVTVISAEPDAENSVSNIARLCQTSAHVVLAGLSSGLRREVV